MQRRRQAKAPSSLKSVATSKRPGVCATTSANTRHARSVGDATLCDRFARGFFVERDDDEGLVVFRRTVPRELPHARQQRLLDLLGGGVAVLAQRALETPEAVRLAVVVDRLDQSVAVENEPVAGRES